MDVYGVRRRSTFCGSGYRRRKVASPPVQDEKDDAGDGNNHEIQLGQLSGAFHVQDSSFD